MKKISIILISLMGVSVFGNNLNPEMIKEDSDFKISHTAHFGTTVILKNINGKVVPLKQIEYRASCRKGKVKIEKHYHTVHNEVIIKEEQCKASEYISLWNDLINSGLEELAALPLNAAVDPFEFIDSWRIEQDTHSFHFRIGSRTIDFTLYDIESYRDKRFKKVLNRGQEFFSVNSDRP